ILQRLQSMERKAYIVGGAVRDLMLGLEPKDYDIVSEATPDEIEAAFPKTVGVGKQFGIMVIVTNEGPVEVARFRADGAYTDGRHPDEIIFADPAADAARRDFTINALFYDLEAGEVIDYVNGLQDLDGRLIRCVGEPARRFEEDALRMLRAVRFHNQLSSRKFRLDPELVAAIRPLSSRLALVSRERITQEMERVLLSLEPSVGLNDLVAANLWEETFRCPFPPAFAPELIDGIIENHLKHFGTHPGIVLPLSALEAHVPGFTAEHAFVLAKADKASLRAITAFRSRLLAFDEGGLAVKKRILMDPSFPITWSVSHTTELEELPLLKIEWEKAGRLNPPTLLKPADLVELGVPKGPEIGRTLEALRDEQLEERVLDIDAALLFVKGRLPKDTVS
ncbi:MAG: CCA tRNA nucleotidyltransferase, partial [Proteobacteria bacterium]